MENASKALIMAAGVLISILLISLMVVFFRRAGMLNAEFDNQASERELEKFNSQFEIYAKDDNNFFDVLTVANLAYDVNKRNGWEANNGVEIKIKKSNDTVVYSIKNNSGLQKNYFFEGDTTATQKYMYEDDVVGVYAVKQAGKDQYKYNFKCDSISYNETTGKVKEMQFKIDEKY